jgi:hypothetical protein
LKSHLARVPVDKRKKRFEEWIDDTGVEVLAERLKVSVATVKNWKFGYCDPRVEHIRQIKQMTNGEIGYDQMIDRGRKILAKNWNLRIRKYRKQG